MEWRLATIRHDGREQAAACVEGEVFPLGGTADGLFVDWPAADARAARAVEGVPLSAGEFSFAPPLRPGAVFCAGANYVDHVIEMVGRPPAAKQGSEPFFFMKPGPQSLAGHREAVALPHLGAALDWEAEIAVVIGRRARHVGVDEAMDFVAGYTIVNDLSARDLMKRADVAFTYDWIGQKCFPGSLPAGQWITPVSAIDDPHDLAIRLWVNDVIMQDSSSRQMHWTIPEQIAYLSRRVGLNPGDLIATGTPAGCGVRKGIILGPGDVVRIEIQGLGSLVNGIVDVEAAR